MKNKRHYLVGHALIMARKKGFETALVLTLF